MPAFGMNTAKRKGVAGSTAPRSSKSGGDTTHSAVEIGSTMFRSAASGALPATSVGVAFSAATYQASSPCGDATILETDATGSRPHVFAAVIHAERTAHGGDALRRHLYREMLQQLKMSSGGDPLAAMKGALVTLDLKFRSQHLYHSNVLAGVQITAAWLDLATNRLHLVSNGGGAQVVVASARARAPEIVIELGRSAPASAASSQSPPASSRGSVTAAEQLPSPADSLASSRTMVLSRQASATSETAETAAAGSASEPAALQRFSEGARILPAGAATLQLTEDVDHIILGSPGFWNELTADQAASRAQGVAESAPHAAGGNAAAHLAQLALQAVCERTQRQQSDPRMASLQTVADLQQLWVGSRANYKWGGRQPLRRRRGDVHGDVTAVVLRLDWDGGMTLRKDSMPSKLRRVGSAAAMPKGGAGSFGDLRAKGLASHWDLVRMHFLEWRPRARAAARSRWYSAVDAAVAAAAAERAAGRIPVPRTAAAPVLHAAPLAGEPAIAAAVQQQQQQAVSVAAVNTPARALGSQPAAGRAVPPSAVPAVSFTAGEASAASAPAGERSPEAKAGDASHGKLVSLVARATGSWRGMRASLASPRASPAAAPGAQPDHHLERSFSLPQSLRARFEGLAAVVAPGDEAQDAAQNETAARRKALGGFSRRRLQVSHPLPASPSVAVH